MSKAHDLATQFMEQWQHRMKQVDIPILEGWFNQMVPEGILKPEPRFKVLSANRVLALEELLNNHAGGYKYVGSIDHPTLLCVLMERDYDRHNQEKPQVLNRTEGASEAGQQGLFTEEA